MNRKEARFWLCAAIISTCAWITSSDPATRTFFATVSGFDCGEPGGTHVDNPCDSDATRRLGFVDRVAWQRRKLSRGEQGAA